MKVETARIRHGKTVSLNSAVSITSVGLYEVISTAGINDMLQLCVDLSSARVCVCVCVCVMQ